jgi:prolyl-tRNA editing enzyme YbaK/EbsC (Cys-tRNA(Pro) deacylase)
MAIERVREYFKKYGMENRVMEFEVSSATVELAAEALGCAPCRIAKTLSFMVTGSPILIVTAGDEKVDNHKYKEKFGVKAKMLTPEEVEKLVGHAVGGVCPFAVNDGVTVYLDESLKRFETVFPACGSSNSAIEMTMEELEKYSGFVSWVDVCKGREIGDNRNISKSYNKHKND